VGKVSKALNKVESVHKPDFTSPAPPDEPQVISSSTVAEERKRKVAAKAPSLPPDLGASTENWDERLVHAIETFSGVAESFRKLRTMILHPESGEPPRSVMVVSCDPQEGKSFVCANLGVSFAHSVKEQALVIDCDLRRPSLQSLFGLKHARGLTEYLRDGDNISDMIYATGLPKLSIIPSGSPPDNPSELLSSDRMSAMLDELADMADNRLLVLDSPPFHVAAETLVLSQLVDKVVLVVRWGKSGRENIKKMVDRIGREKIIGVVFNAFEFNILDKKIQGVGYHNYYAEEYY